MRKMSTWGNKILRNSWRARTSFLKEKTVCLCVRKDRGFRWLSSSARFPRSRVWCRKDETQWGCVSTKRNEEQDDKFKNMSVWLYMPWSGNFRRFRIWMSSKKDCSQSSDITKLDHCSMLCLFIGHCLEVGSVLTLFCTEGCTSSICPNLWAFSAHSAMWPPPGRHFCGLLQVTCKAHQPCPLGSKNKSKMKQPSQKCAAFEDVTRPSWREVPSIFYSPTS